MPEWPSELRTKKAPDFLEKGGHCENYESKWILGKLHRHSKLLLETVSELSNRRCNWNRDDDNNNDNSCNDIAETAKVAENANLLQESYEAVMRNLQQTYNIQTEINVWRARLPDFAFTDEDRRRCKMLSEDFRYLHWTMKTQYRSAVRELKKCGIKEDNRRPLYCHCKQLITKPSCAGLSLMLSDAKPRNETGDVCQSDYVYRQIGREILRSLTPSKCRLMTTKCIRLLVYPPVTKTSPSDQQTNERIWFAIPMIYVLLNHPWLLASASFLVQRLCPTEDNISQTLNCIFRVLLHVSVKLEFCSADDIARSKDVTEFWTTSYVKYMPWTFIARRLKTDLGSFLSSTDKTDFLHVGKSVVYGLWDIYTKREDSKEDGYEYWERQLKGDAIEMLLTIAFRNGFDAFTGNTRCTNQDTKRVNWFE